VQQNPSDPVISDSYQELGYDLADAARYVAPSIRKMRHGLVSADTIVPERSR
jgi:hypothetical protein